jgi:hypothetical protein
MHKQVIKKTYNEWGLGLLNQIVRASFKNPDRDQIEELKINRSRLVTSMVKIMPSWKLFKGLKYKSINHIC